jgi:hypothetical protein
VRAELPVDDSRIEPRRVQGLLNGNGFQYGASSIPSRSLWLCCAGATGAGAFELLTFFAATAHTLDVRANFWARCVALLSACGFHTGYATTARRPLPMYRRGGWQVLEEREIEFEKRYFLQYRVPRCEPREETARQMLGLLIEAQNLGQTSNVPR